MRSPTCAKQNKNTTPTSNAYSLRVPSSQGGRRGSGRAKALHQQWRRFCPVIECRQNVCQTTHRMQRSRQIVLQECLQANALRNSTLQARQADDFKTSSAEGTLGLHALQISERTHPKADFRPRLRGPASPGQSASPVPGQLLQGCGIKWLHALLEKAWQWPSCRTGNGSKSWELPRRSISLAEDHQEDSPLLGSLISWTPPTFSSLTLSILKKPAYCVCYRFCA